MAESKGLIQALLDDFVKEKEVGGKWKAYRDKTNTKWQGDKGTAQKEAELALADE